MSAEAYYHLLYKKLLERLSTDEERVLRSWLSESEENRRAAAEIEALFRVSADEPPPVHVADELAAFKIRLHSTASKMPPQPAPTAIYNPLRRWAWVAAASFLLLSGAFLLLRKAAPPHPEWVVVSSDLQQNQMVTLPDGSRAWLNHHSTLRFVRSFEGFDERNVQIEGEAFFEVHKDAAHPFVVEAGPCQVRVLGTSFNVRAVTAEPTCEVEVRTGRVRVSSLSADSGSPGTAVELHAGQQAIYEKTEQRLRALARDPAQVADWREASITLQKVPLQEAVLRLGRQFGQQIEVDNPALTHCPYSGYFPRKDLTAVLANLQSVFGVQVEKTASGYRLTGGQCPR